MSWNRVQDNLPCSIGVSEPVLVVVQEFGQKPSRAVAVCFVSVQKQAAKWFLDMDFYHHDRPYEIAEPVILWMPLPAIPIREGVA